MDTRNIERKLAERYKYKKLPGELSEKYRKYFSDNIPDFLKGSEALCTPLFTYCGTLLCGRFERIVIGDYGAFVEFDGFDANLDKFVVARGQEYRLNDPRYLINVKYEWFTVNDGSNIKLYRQKRHVDYADYLPGKWYVSVHEVTLATMLP